MLTFDTPEDTLTVTPERLAIAGWAGRDPAAIRPQFGRKSMAITVPRAYLRAGNRKIISSNSISYRATGAVNS